RGAPPHRRALAAQSHLLRHPAGAGRTRHARHPRGRLSGDRAGAHRADANPVHSRPGGGTHRSGHSGQSAPEAGGRPRGGPPRGSLPLSRAPGWALRREYRSTYRDTVVASEKVIAGRWWRAPRAAAAPVPVSLEADVAADLGVRIGDEMVWDVQGGPVPTRVANLRDVDWARFEPNFFAVFASGALERAPQSYVILTRTPDASARGRLQRELAER